MNQPLLQTTATAKAFGPVVALRSVDLTVAPGEVHALLGANGAGKSTLVKILTGVLHADAGTIAIHGEEVALRQPSDARARGLAPVFQDPAMVRDLTITQNLRLTGADVDEVHGQLAAMDIDGLDFNEQVRDLPLPFLRMLDLARAMAFDPQLLVLDEITAALPPDLSDRVFEVMRRWKERNRSVLFISHRLAEVREHCDMCTVLRDGRNVASFVPGTGGEGQIVQAMLGEAASLVREEARARAHAHDAESRPRLEVRSVAAGRQLKDVSLSVRAGEVLGLVALEGPGSGPAVRRAVGQSQARRRRDRRGRPTPARRPSLRRHPPGRGPRAERPAHGVAAQALGAGEHRRAAVQPDRRVGPDQPGQRAPPRRRRRPAPLDRHPGRRPGAAAVRREPAEGDHRPLAGRRVPHAPALRPDPRASTSAPSTRSTTWCAIWPTAARPS